jgi:phosphoesterase RecJ-like protein
MPMTASPDRAERLAPREAGACIRAARSVLVTSHVRPDGDSIGSMVALTLGLRQAGIEAVAWAATPVPRRYSFLDPAITQPPRAADQLFDLCVILDTATLSRVDLDQGLVRACGGILAVDHHPDLGEFPRACIDTTAGATAILVHDILGAMGVTITRPMADALYAGVLTDTGSFTYSNTDHRAFALALAMVDAGTDPALVARMVYDTMTRPQILLLADMLSTLEFLGGGRAALMHISDAMFARTGSTEADIEDFVNHARAIEGVRVAALLSESGGTQVRISLRAKTPDVAVNTLAARYGGGGHPCAAGATVAGRLADVLPSFRTTLESFATTLRN